MTVTVETATETVRVEHTIPAGHDRLAVSRTGPSGAKEFVRGYQEFTVTPGANVVARDYEAPIGVPLTYTTETWANATPATITTATGTVTIPDGGCEDTWLTDLVEPANSQKIVIESLDELAYEIPATVHRILGRRAPIVSSDIAWTPELEIEFLTATLAERDKAKETLGTGFPFLLRTPPANGIGNLYLSVTEFREQRPFKLARVPDRRFAASCVQVERPDPALSFVPADYFEVEAGFEDYADVKASRPSYLELYEQAAPWAKWPPVDA